MLRALGTTCYMCENALSNGANSSLDAFDLPTRADEPQMIATEPAKKAGGHALIASARAPEWIDLWLRFLLVSLVRRSNYLNKLVFGSDT